MKDKIKKVKKFKAELWEDTKAKVLDSFTSPSGLTENRNKKKTTIKKRSKWIRKKKTVTHALRIYTKEKDIQQRIRKAESAALNPL